MSGPWYYSGIMIILLNTSVQKKLIYIYICIYIYLVPVHKIMRANRNGVKIFPCKQSGTLPVGDGLTSFQTFRYSPFPCKIGNSMHTANHSDQLFVHPCIRLNSSDFNVTRFADKYSFINNTLQFLPLCILHHSILLEGWCFFCYHYLSFVVSRTGNPLLRISFEQFGRWLYLPSKKCHSYCKSL